MDLKLEIAKRGKKAIEYLLMKSEEKIHPEALREAAEHYLRAGGKGFRPAMLQLVCGALGGDEELALPVAAAIEAVHVSSLIHDDMMDQDETRRGVEAVWKKWGNTIAILAGDVLIGIGYVLASEMESIDDDICHQFSTKLANIYVELCHGQMLDISFENKEFTDITVEEITKMQYLKTGVLFEFSCVTGAKIALNSTDDPLIDTVREYAKLAGTAFQIQDDIIGLLGDEEKVGKPIGSDIREGKRTLIAVHAVLNADDTQKELLITTLGNHKASEDEIKSCLNTMQVIGSVDYAKNMAQDMAEKAMKLVDELPVNDQSKLLKMFAAYMIEREF